MRCHYELNRVLMGAIDADPVEALARELEGYADLGLDTLGPRGKAPRAAALETTPREVAPGVHRPASATSLEVVVLSVERDRMRCRVSDEEAIVTFRGPGCERVVPGHVAALGVHARWRRAERTFLSGVVESTRLDIAALGLTPLALTDCGPWDPSEFYVNEANDGSDEFDEVDDFDAVDEVDMLDQNGELHEDDEFDGHESEEPRLEPWERAIVAQGVRTCYEMEQVIPGEDPEDPDVDPIIEASEAMQRWQHERARSILHAVLEQDLRCIDAHVHLGHSRFDFQPDRALLHYEVARSIGDLTLGAGFRDVLLWGLLDNRPYLRALHGLGLCLWRLERWEEAESLFERMLFLNPGDNQGIRFLLPEVQARRRWVRDSDNPPPPTW